MISRNLDAYRRMKQVAEQLLGEAFTTEKHYRDTEGFHYEFSSRKGSVHFTDEASLSEVEAYAKEECGKIKSVQVSENIFCHHCRYIYHYDKDSKNENNKFRIRHYAYENYTWEELVARLKIIDIIDNLKYGAYPILKPGTTEKESGIMGKPILEFEKGNTKELHRLFELVGYSREELHNSWEPTSVYFSIATRLLYDDDYEVNKIGRGVMNHLIRQLR